MKSLPIESEYYDPNTEEFITKEEFINRWNQMIDKERNNKSPH